MADLDTEVQLITINERQFAIRILAREAIGGFTLPLQLDGMRITEDGYLQLFNSDQNKYHTVLVQGDAGAEYITIGAGET